MTKRPFPLDFKTILDLQRTAGNRYVGGLLRSQAAHTAKAQQPPAAEATSLGMEPVAAEPRKTALQWSHLATYSSFIGPIVIGVVAAVGMSLAFLHEFPSLPQAAAIGAGSACGALAWYASRRLIYHRKGNAARARL